MSLNTKQRNTTTTTVTNPNSLTTLSNQPSPICSPTTNCTAPGTTRASGKSCSTGTFWTKQRRKIWPTELGPDLTPWARWLITKMTNLSPWSINLAEYRLSSRNGARTCSCPCTSSWVNKWREKRSVTQWSRLSKRTLIRYGVKGRPVFTNSST